MHAIRLGDLHPDPENARKTFRKETIGRLAGTIEKAGLLQNLVVRTHPELEGQYFIVCGERRYRAFKLLQEHSALIPVGGESIECDDDFPVACVLIDGPNEGNIRVINLLENTGREDMTIWELGFAYHELAEESDMTQADIGKAVGKSQWHVGSHILIATQLHPAVLEKLRTLQSQVPSVPALLKIVKAKDELGRPDKQKQLELLGHQFTRLQLKSDRRPSIKKQLGRLTRMNVKSDVQPVVEAVITYLNGGSTFEYEQKGTKR